MGFRMKDFNIMEVHWKTRFLVWFMKNQYMGELPKTEGLGGGNWEICRFRRREELGKKEMGGAFEGGNRMIPPCTLCTFLLKQHIPNETNIKLSKRNLSAQKKLSYIIYRCTKTDDVIFTKAKCFSKGYK